jgi:hypothetical protein
MDRVNISIPEDLHRRASDPDNVGALAGHTIHPVRVAAV